MDVRRRDDTAQPQQLMPFLVPAASQFQKLRLEVYAIDKIAAGSEVTIEYVPALLTQTREERARTLRETFGFSQCQCALCTAPPAVTEASDRRREEVREISRALSRGAGGKKDKIAMLDRMRALLTQEGYKSLPEFGACCCHTGSASLQVC